MAQTSESSVTALARAWSFMIIFCFAGCAAGSCLSYGHSCWGAHGKRSGVHSAAYLIPSKTMNEVQQDVPSFPKEQMILSRLISRPSMSNKYRGRWGRLFFKTRTSFPDQWDDVEINTHPINVNLQRDQNNNEDTDDGTRKRMNDLQVVTGNSIGERKDVPEMLLISNNDNVERDSKPENVELFKFLSDINDNYE